MAEHMQSFPTIQLTALVSDPIDGMIRLLGDVQRFGLRLVGAEMKGHAGASMIVLTLETSVEVDLENLSARFGRHAGLLRPPTIGKPLMMAALLSHAA